MKGSEIQGPSLIILRGEDVCLEFPSNLCLNATLSKVRIAATVFIAMQFSVRIRRVIPTCRAYTCGRLCQLSVSVEELQYVLERMQYTSLDISINKSSAGIQLYNCIAIGHISRLKNLWVRSSMCWTRD